MTFEQWVNDVDQHVQAQIGVSMHDLSDTVFLHDAFDDGEPALDVALRIIEQDSTFDMFSRAGMVTIESDSVKFLDSELA